VEKKAGLKRKELACAALKCKDIKEIN